MSEGKTLREIAELVGGTLLGDPGRVVRGVSGVREAGPEDVTFLGDKRYAEFLGECRAGCILLSSGDVKVPEGVGRIVVKDPHLAFAKVMEVLKPHQPPPPGIHPRAEVHPEVVLGRDVCVQAFSFIEKGARIGDRVVIYPYVYIGRDVEIGEDSIIYPGVVIREGCRLGRRVIVHCNAVIGSDGFGYARDGMDHYKIPQVGVVRVEDDVEIGACTTIDRATTGETVIGRGTKIDNLVQIAHNVKIGERTIVVAQVGISGSTTIGRDVILAGQVGVVGHIRIEDGIRVGAQSGVIHDIKESGTYTGTPAVPHMRWLRAQSLFLKLPEIKKTVDELKKRLEKIEGKKDD